MKILIVCSKHFYNYIEKVKSFLEGRGHEVSLPNSYNEPFAEERFRTMSAEDHIEWKSMMMRMDESNIEPQDAILVLNFEKNGIPNYVGGATFLEIYVAWKMRKKIFFYNPLPNCSFTDELRGINPILINGNLEMIR
jgi:diphthamide synthase subunit DPH2